MSSVVELVCEFRSLLVRILRSYFIFVSVLVQTLGRGGLVTDRVYGGFLFRPLTLL